LYCRRVARLAPSADVRGQHLRDASVFDRRAECLANRRSRTTAPAIDLILDTSGR
jgi:hypothetical protein